MLPNLKTFWHETFLQSRIALVIFGIAVAVHVLSLLGLTTEAWIFVFFPLHIGIMALIFTAIAKMMYVPFVDPDHAPLSRLPYSSGQLWILTVGLFIYAAVWFGAAFTYYGEGQPILRNGQSIWLAPSGASHSISPTQFCTVGTISMAVFSAVWAAFALLLAIIHDRVTRRLRRARAAAA
jgi:hypothetical protein